MIDPATFFVSLFLFGWLGSKFMDWMDEQIEYQERDTTIYKNCDACEYGCNWISPCATCECHQPEAM